MSGPIRGWLLAGSVLAVGATAARTTAVAAIRSAGLADSRIPEGGRWSRLILLAASVVALSTPVAAKDSAATADAGAPPDLLQAGFANPPSDARPRVWWHWLNGNVTEEGVVRDLVWMKDVGLGGAQVFDAAMQTPQIVAERQPFMSPGWQQALRTAAREAESLGLEIAVASSPGFTESGGPWVVPEDGMKKLVWSETEIAGKPGKLAAPPSVTGPFGSIPADPTGGLLLTGTGNRLPVAAPFYRDIAVLAWPVGNPSAAPRAQFFDGDGKVVDAAPLMDDDFATVVELARSPGKDASLEARFASPVTMRSARLFIPASSGRYAGATLKPVLEVGDDSGDWRLVGEFPGSSVPATISFAPVEGNRFRIVFKRAGGGLAAGFVPPVAGLDMSALGRMMGGGGIGSDSGIKVGDFRLFSEPKVDRAETRAGFDIAANYFELPGNAPDDRGVPLSDILDLTSKLRSDGSLDWNAPPGRWKVLRLGWSLTGVVNHPASPEATGLEVDKYDGSAVRRYLEHYTGLLRQAVGANLIGERGIRALLNDSIESGPANWTPRMREKFIALRGYDPLPWFPALAGEIVVSRERSNQFLFDYRRTLADLIASEHYGTIARFAHEKGLTVYGEAQENARPQMGDDIAMRRYADIPMGALWTFPRNKGAKPNYLVDLRGAASVANIYGKRFVAAELMTSLLAPWAYGPQDLKRVADLAFASGVNRPIIHTSVHVPTDDRKPGLSLSVFGQYFNRNESWASLARPWVEYLSRNAFLLQQGRTVSDLAYYYGEEAPLTGLYSARQVPNAPRTIGYDFVNSDALMSELRNDGADLVTRGGARYRALYLGGSSRKMSLATLRKIQSLVEGGATVIGSRPDSDPGNASDDSDYSRIADILWPGSSSTLIGKGRVNVDGDIETVLKGLGIPSDFRASGAAADADIAFLHRRFSDGEIYFLSNRKPRDESFEARFRVVGKAPELWDAVSGAISPVSYRTEGDETIVPLTIPIDGSMHVVFRKMTSEKTKTVVPSSLVEAARLVGPWDVSFEPGRGAPLTARMASLSPLDQNSDPAIRYFSGVASYAQVFRPPAAWKPGQALWLDLGDLSEIAEVELNGQRIGGVWTRPFRLDLGRSVRRGKNQLVVRVANLWVNRLIGDAQPGAQKVTWTASPTYTASAPLRKSGLIGPVTLLLQGKSLSALKVH